ncbi:MAG: ornithine cyclodeaminase family protein [Actinobacteria bacterium]|nr:ornithine cyclodeaminase family protein [Actinomycetota bacterium]
MSERDEPIWIAEADAAALLSIEDAIEALAGAHRLYAEGEAANMVKTQAQSGPSNLHAVGAIIAGQEIAGTKTWMHTPGGAQPLLILISPEDGRVRAVIEAFALGQRRTSATSALATRELAREDAATMALVGTGKQAVAQAEAVAAVRPLTAISVYGRDPGRRAACVARLQDRVEAYVREEPSLEAALVHADIVTLVTRAAEPFVEAAMIAPGTHVNGVGAILPDRRELAVEAVAGFDLIAVDSLPQARSASGELNAAVAAGRLDWDEVAELGQVLTGAAPGRGGAGERTFFKAMGVGIADVALGAEVLRRARAEGVGVPLPAREITH